MMSIRSLDIWSVSDPVLASIRKVWRLRSPQKTQKLLQRSHGGSITVTYFSIQNKERSLQVMHITAPILDGVIGFKHPGEAAVAEYLRRRFRVAELSQVSNRRSQSLIPSGALIPVSRRLSSAVIDTEPARENARA